MRTDPAATPAADHGRVPGDGGAAGHGWPSGHGAVVDDGRAADRRKRVGRPAVREMARTVHPELAAAVLGEVERRAGRSPAPVAGEVRRLLAGGTPVPEELHRALLGVLYTHGWQAVRAAGRLLLERPADPRLRALLAAPDVAEAFTRARLVEPWLHVGHRTGTVLAPGELTVRHVGYLGRRPEPAESLFVCAIHAAGVAAIAGTDPETVLLAADGRPFPPEAAWRAGAPAPRGWRLRWTEPSAPATPPVAAMPPAPATPSAPGPAHRPGPALVAEVRRRIALDPAATWRVAGVAARLGTSPRSLQRAFTAAGTTFQAELAAVRLDVAGHLIRRTRLPLAEVAAAAGFTDHPHLTRRFRARHGCPPTRFRAGAE